MMLMEQEKLRKFLTESGDLAPETSALTTTLPHSFLELESSEIDCVSAAELLVAYGRN